MAPEHVGESALGRYWRRGLWCGFVARGNASGCDSFITEFFTMSSKFNKEMRTRSRAAITRFYNDKANFGEYDFSKLKLSISKLEKIEKDLPLFDEKIFEADFTSDGITDSNISVELNACQEYQDRICECLSLLNISLQALISTNSAGGGPGVGQAPPYLPGGAARSPLRSQLKSPVAPLPRFSSSEGENLTLFLEQFEETLSKFTYTSYDKLLLLKQQVSGKASLLIESLEPEKQTYEDAKVLLTSALASKDVQKFNIIKKLSELKLPTTGEPFQYIADIRKIMQGVKSLQITVDDILGYFVFSGLNELFKNQLTLVTNNTRPEINEIIDKFFLANERYEIARKNLKSSKVSSKPEAELTALASISRTQGNQNPFNCCSLCSDSSHGINRCQSYPTPSDKLARLRKLNACESCANIGHTKDVCGFRFKKACSNCNKWHFSFLCPERKEEKNFKILNKNLSPANSKLNSSSNANFKGKTKVNANLTTVLDRPDLPGDQAEATCYTVCANFFQKNLHDVDSVLSTCTIKTKSKLVRSLYDLGSQSSFVTEETLKFLDHVVLKESVNLTIKGINNEKTIKSKLVEAKLCFGFHEFYVKLLTVPSISISLKLPGLGNVVQAFLNKGFTLADQLLNANSQKIDSISIILGANAAFCFEGSTVTFGNSSVYLSTIFGELLIGSVKQMLSDLAALKCNFLQFSEGSSETSDIETNACAISLGFALGNNSLPDQNLSDGSEYNSMIKCVDESQLDKCSDEILDNSCSFLLNKENYSPENSSELDTKLINYLIQNYSRAEDGRIILPLLWNPDVKHLLSKNFNLAKKVLFSNFKKLEKDKAKLDLVECNIRELESAGIIERVSNLEDFLKENPTCSFLAHSQIFKPQKETTKCRMVFMSNLAEKFDKNCHLSHNQVIYSGPSINQKLTSALMHLRFQSFLLAFDVVRAFCQIQVPESDAKKLMFLWFKDAKNGNLELQAFKNVRLSFGVRCAPTILMVALYQMLVADAQNDDERTKNLKSLIYALSYMDNCALAANSQEDLIWAYKKLPEIFGPYKLDLQQFCTNEPQLKAELHAESDAVQLLGVTWYTDSDTLEPKKKFLDQEANTKRKVLQTIAKNFDPHNIEGPLLNRARLYMHDLQCRDDLAWDTVLSQDLQRSWKNICAQLNNSEPIRIPRCVGERGAQYKIICFSDSSKQIYGCVVYLQNLETKEVYFMLAKNRIVNKSQELRSIPSLELAAMSLGMETLSDVKKELSGEQCIFPINIAACTLYCDSLVCLNWLNAYANKLEKLNNASIFVKNRLDKICKYCANCPTEFRFVDGVQNPADFITRSVSSKILKKSNYISGPSFLKSSVNSMSRPDILTFSVPNPNHMPNKQVKEHSQTSSLVSVDGATASDARTTAHYSGGGVECVSCPASARAAGSQAQGSDEFGAATADLAMGSGRSGEGYPVAQDSNTVSGTDQLCAAPIEEPLNNKLPDPLVPIESYSNFKKYVRVHEKVLRFCNNLKRKLKIKNSQKYEHLCLAENTSDLALKYVLKEEQLREFPEVLDYFSSAEVGSSRVPNQVQQLNCFVDSDGLIRVGSKMLKKGRQIFKYCPILLSKSSYFSKMLILDYHHTLLHGGIYCILTEIRKYYWLPSCFSTVKKAIKNCVHCKRFNGRTVKLNQSGYRDFRLTPRNLPFSTIAIDYAGPYRTKICNETRKVYVLVVTCLFTRAINLKVSVDLSTAEFLRSFQLHCHERGVPSFVLSDLGSSIVAGADIVQNFLSDPSTAEYFDGMGGKVIKFHHYYKGHHELGSLVETCVKAVKRLISGAIKNNILQMREFEYVISLSIHLANRRPVALKEACRDTGSEILPQPITPELLMHGFDLASTNLIPSLQDVDFESAGVYENFSPLENIKDTDKKLRSVRRDIFQIYNSEFLPHLISQATNDSSRYKPKSHNLLGVGDIVLIKEENTKQTNFPMGRVVSVTKNDLGEVTGAIILKGSSGEKVKRHSSTLIPLLQESQTMENSDPDLNQAHTAPSSAQPARCRRLAAIASERKTRDMMAM